MLIIYVILRNARVSSNMFPLANINLLTTTPSPAHPTSLSQYKTLNYPQYKTLLHHLFPVGYSKLQVL